MYRSLLFISIITIAAIHAGKVQKQAEKPSLDITKALKIAIEHTPKERYVESIRIIYPVDGVA
ncbi:MAG: hypothetical protein AAF571_15770 [Verrucomicrobiota bacterium]